EPELYGYFIPRIFGRQGTKSINALDGPDCRLIERRDTTRLLDLDVLGSTIATYVERQINALGIADPRIDFVLQPILGNLPRYPLNVPGETAAEIAASTGESESAFRASRAEHSIRAADRASLAVGSYVIRRWRRGCFRLFAAVLRLRLCFAVLVGD